MPRLNKYRIRNACYVLTAVRGAFITYQLTPEGEKKLVSACNAAGHPPLCLTVEGWIKPAGWLDIRKSVLARSEVIEMIIQPNALRHQIYGYQTTAKVSGCRVV